MESQIEHALLPSKPAIRCLCLDELSEAIETGTSHLTRRQDKVFVSKRCFMIDSDEVPQCAE
jgi:hypothetical protein